MLRRKLRVRSSLSREPAVTNDGEVGVTLPKFLQEQIQEIALVGSSGNRLCIAIGFLKAFENTTIGWFLFWLLKVTNVISIILIPPPSVLSFKAVMANLMVFLLCSSVSFGLLYQYLGLDVGQQRKYIGMHHFTLNYMWALEAVYFLRAAALLIMIIKESVSSNSNV